MNLSVDEEMKKKKKLGNGVVGILAESVNKWERRTPLTPSHCSRLLQDRTGVSRIVVQPSEKRIYHDALYSDVGCEISDDLSDCGIILCIKQPKLEMILPERAYAFFSHIHRAQKEKMPLLDKILSERVTLYDYELIVGDHGKRLLAFGIYAGRAGLVDFLHGLGQSVDEFNFRCRISKSRILNSFPLARFILYGLPLGICPLVFVFTGTGNVSLGAQEMFKLLPHTFVEPSNLPELFVKDKGMSQNGKSTKRVHQVYGCIITSQDMVEHQDPSKSFDKADYYAHPEHYNPVFHDKIAPYTSVLVNCMYWEKKFPRLLSTKQVQDLAEKGCPLVGICDITCDIGGSVEFVNRATSIDSPFFRFDPINNSYYNDMDGDGVLCMAIDILPTEFAKEASQHFGDILSEFVGSLASVTEVSDLPGHLKKACISYRGELTPLYEHIPRMMKSDPEDVQGKIASGVVSNQRTYKSLTQLVNPDEGVDK
ncbi:BnaA03g52370D [Brassica napus]|uniref:BnaA03g52370D protein n=1 Tax=Brassica napus TaxID=3708 RepID=A0A078FKS2_BRANA|nr:BnaA03g52370D [Brassica napus]